MTGFRRHSANVRNRRGALVSTFSPATGVKKGPGPQPSNGPRGAPTCMAERCLALDVEPRPGLAVNVSKLQILKVVISGEFGFFRNGSPVA